MSEYQSARIKELSYDLRAAFKQLKHPIPLQTCLEALTRTLTGLPWNDLLAKESADALAIQERLGDIREQNRKDHLIPGGLFFSLPFPPRFPLYGRVPEFFPLQDCLDPKGFDMGFFTALQTKYFKYWQPRLAWTDGRHSYLLDRGGNALVRIPASSCFADAVVVRNALNNKIATESFDKYRAAIGQHFDDHPDDKQLVSYVPPETDSQPCENCNGHGKVLICPECEGTTEVEANSDRKTYSLDCEECEKGYLTLGLVGQTVVQLTDAARDKSAKRVVCCDCFGLGKSLRPVDYHGCPLDPYVLKSLARRGFRIGTPQPFPMDSHVAIRFQVDEADGLLLIPQKKITPQ